MMKKKLIMDPRYQIKVSKKPSYSKLFQQQQKQQRRTSQSKVKQNLVMDASKWKQSRSHKTFWTSC